MNEYNAERAATDYKAWFLSAICFGLGGIFFWLFGGLDFAGIGQSFGATLISIGAIVVIYELIMRRQLQEELLKLVGVERSVWEHKLVSVGKSSTVDWRVFLHSKSDIRLVLLHPSQWIESC